MQGIRSAGRKRFILGTSFLILFLSGYRIVSANEPSRAKEIDPVKLEALKDRLSQRTQTIIPKTITPKSESGPKEQISDKALARRRQHKSREKILLAKDALALESLFPFGKISIDKKASKFLARHNPAANNSILSHGTNEYFVGQYLSMESYEYVDYMDYVFWGAFQAPSDAQYIYLNFSFVDLESGYDKVYVYDYVGTLCDSVTGYSSSGRNTVACSGNYADVRVYTDSSNSGASGYDGFTIRGYTYGVEAPNAPPVAIADVDTLSVTIGDSFYFTGYQSYDPDSGDTIDSYYWDFDDGYSSSSSNISYRYDAPGIYYPTLTVWDRNEASSSDTVRVVVREVPKPVSFAVNETLARSISVRWQAPSQDASGFVINKSLGFSSDLDCDGGTDVGYVTSHRLTGLVPNSNYTIVLCTYNEHDYFSDKVTVFVSTTPIVYPPAPTNLSVIFLGAHRMGVSWASGGGNTDRFAVAIDQGSTPPPCFAGIDYGDRDQHIFYQLKERTLYTMTVCAKNADGDFSSRASISATTLSIVYPPAPINLITSDLFANRVTLNWQNGGGNTATFFVEISPGSVTAQCGTNNVGGFARSHTFTSLASSSIYTLTVCAGNSEYDLSLPASIIITTPAPPAIPPAVVGLSTSEIGVTSITLSWQSGGGTTDSYRIVSARSSTAPGCSSSGSVVTGTTFTATGLTGNTLYSFSVCALNNISVVGPASNVQATTVNGAIPPNPTSLELASKTTSSLELRWTSGGGTTQTYRVAHVAGTSAPSDCSGGISTSNTSHMLTGLSHFTLYSVRVCAINSIQLPSSGSTLSGRTFDLDVSNVTSFAKTGVTQNSMSFSWNYSGSNQGGDFLMAHTIGNVAPNSCSGGNAASLTSRTHTVSSLSPNTVYSFRICARNGDNVTSSGVTLSDLRTLAAPPPNPRRIRARAMSTSIALSWRTGGGSTVGYLVSHSAGTAPAVGCPGGTRVTSATHAITGLTRNTLYRLRLCSVNADGVASTGVSFTRRTRRR